MQISFIWNDNVLEYTGDKPKNNSEGMAISLEKWRLIIEKLKELRVWNHYIGEEDINCNGIKTCGLCMINIHGSEYSHNDCKNCPIYLKTGSMYCGCTPHDQWMPYDTGGNDVDEMIEVAEQELQFLQDIKYDNNL